eukprot:3225221-Rhodomonas_salina.1
MEQYILNKAPHIQYEIIEPECYAGGNVYYNYGCSLYWTLTDDNCKAMLAVYAAFATLSEQHKGKLLDFTSKDWEPFNDVRCEVYINGHLQKKYKETGQKDYGSKQAELDKRGWEADPIGYFQSMWGHNLATSPSPHEARIRRQEAMREAGMSVLPQPIRSTSERVLTPGEVVETEAQKKQQVLEGEALLCANPVHPLFWQFTYPHILIESREAKPTDPFLAAVAWNDALFIVSPELILPDEWEALDLETDSEQYEKGCLSAMDSSPGGIGWVPGPGYNNLPTTLSTVPTPSKEMKGSNLRTAWVDNLWGSNPAVLYRAMASLLKKGWIEQVLCESGLSISPCLSLR